jgi:hypothetical protein
VFWNHQKVCLVDPVLVPLVLFVLLAFEDHQNLTWLLSGLVIFKTLLTHAGSPYTLTFCLWVSCTHKMHWRVHSLADTVPPFSDHFTLFLRTEQ